MDPVSLIVTALVAGAATGAGDSATKAVSEAYAGLRRLLSQRFGGRERAQTALREHEHDADTWANPLTHAVAETGAAEDPAVLDAATRLLALLDDVGTKAGKYVVDARGAQGVQIGDRNTQTNTFGVSSADRRHN